MAATSLMVGSVSSGSWAMLIVLSLLWMGRRSCTGGLWCLLLPSRRTGECAVNRKGNTWGPVVACSSLTFLEISFSTRYLAGASIGWGAPPRTLGRGRRAVGVTP